MIIDAHTHVFAAEQMEARDAICASDATFAELYTDHKAKLATAEMLVGELDAAGIDGAVIAGFAFARAEEVARQNRAILEAARRSPRLIPLATINLSLPGWRGEAERALADGARGFGELRPHNQGWDPLGREARLFYELAHEAGSVLLWHVSEPVGHMYAGKRGGITPAELYGVAEAAPDLRMIAAHLGGGLSFFLYMQEARSTLRNVFFDTAAWRFLYDGESIAQVIAQAGALRVLFGSDYPLLSPGGELQRLKALLPDATTLSVCGTAAEILFRNRD